MKSLLKFAMGAAIAGALVNLAMRQMKQRSEGRSSADNGWIPYADDPPRGESGFTLAELATKNTAAGADEVGVVDDSMRTAGERPASFNS